MKKALGFEKGVTPHQSTIHRLFRRLSADEGETAFRSLAPRNSLRQRNEVHVRSRLMEKHNEDDGSLNRQKPIQCMPSVSSIIRRASF